jgi:hypothetical protein
LGNQPRDCTSENEADFLFGYLSFLAGEDLAADLDFVFVAQDGAFQHLLGLLLCIMSLVLIS